MYIYIYIYTHIHIHIHTHVPGRPVRFGRCPLPALPFCRLPNDILEFDIIYSILYCNILYYPIPSYTILYKLRCLCVPSGFQLYVVTYIITSNICVYIYIYMIYYMI